MGYYKSKIEDYSKIKSDMPIYGEKCGDVQEIKSMQEVMESLKENINIQAQQAYSNSIENIKSDSSLSNSEKNFELLMQEYNLNSILNTGAKDYFKTIAENEVNMLTILKARLEMKLPENDTRLFYATEAMEELKSLTEEERLGFVVDRCACEGSLAFKQEDLFGYLQVEGFILDPKEKLYFAKQYPLRQDEQFDLSTQPIATPNVEQ